LQQEFAEMIGTAREVINRTFKRFEQNGLLRLTADSIFILDLERLTAIAEQETT
jgi:CRP-like cAMP-binding protein